MIDPEQEGFAVALEAQARSYSPYSKFAVGSAAKLKGHDQAFPGCNVENASFGGTVCAERSAILSAISQTGLSEFEWIVIVTDTDPAAGPCALCLQTIQEFFPKDAKVYFANQSGIQRCVTVEELLPYSFGFNDLA